MLKDIRGQFLVWFGIVGGMLTIVNHWSNFITLANWARWIIEHWGNLLYRFWEIAGNLINIHISKDEALSISLAIFSLSLYFGTMIQSKYSGEWSDWKYAGKPFSGIRHNLFIALVLMAYLFLSESNSATNELHWLGINVASLVVALVILLIIYIRIWLRAMLMHEKIYVFSVFIIITLIFTPYFSAYYRAQENHVWLKWLIWVMFTPIWFAPLRLMTKRFTFMLIGVALIFGLSEVSNQVQQLRIANTAINTQ